jgi:trans-aconitate 2-methyltransferase
MDAWNPTQYERFKLERRQPFDDLLELVSVQPQMRVVDLGSGTGELTRVLHERLGAAETLGLDRSEAMRARSAHYAGAGVRFAGGDIHEFTAEGEYDLVFSNAALQWVPDHPGLFAHLTHALKPSGQLALQMPANYDHPSHTVAASVASEDAFSAALDGFAVGNPVLAPDRYAELLHRLGFEKQHVRLQVYGHALSSGAEVVEWVSGSLLTAYRQRMDDALFDRFLARYREELATHIDFEQPYFFPFKRILIWATR